MNPIIVLARNNLHLTKKAIASFRKQDIPVEILLVDNQSTDGTSQWANTQSDLGYIYNDPPKSFAASWNQGLWYWFSHGAEYCLVVNNDVELRPDTYRHLLADGGGFVTAVGVREWPEPWVELESGPDPLRKRSHPDFSCLLIRRETYELVGKFDECFKVAYCEDSSYHVRMHRVGINAVCLDLPFLHHGAQTVKNADPKEVRMVQLQADENRKLFKKMYGFAVGSKEYYESFGHDAPVEFNKITKT